MANKINNIPQHKTVVNTPTTPDLGFGRIYIKSDNQWYGLDDVGVETQLGGGSGGGINLTSLSANAPITYNNTNGTFSINQSNGSTNGYLSSTDWAMFNSKQGSLTLTTTGSSGAATLVGSTLNIPQYSGGSGGGVAGAGTLNYLPKWTPDGTTLDNSQIQDNGSVLWIETFSSNVKFNVNNSSPSITIGGGFLSSVPGGGVGLNVTGRSSNGLGSTSGIISRGEDGQNNTGLDAGAFGPGSTNIGADLSAWGATENIGAYISAYGDTGTKIGAKIIVQGAGTLYAAQLQDGTETVAGRFLKNIVNGKANWANITAADVSGVQGALTLTTTGSSGAATLTGNTLNIPQYSGGGGGVSGSGTLNKLTKWTPNGTTIGNSAIIEDATGHIGIGDDPLTSSKTYISTTTETYGLRVDTANIDGSYGVYGTASKQGSNFNNQGVRGIASGSTAENIGIYGTASADNSSYASKQMGGRFFAQNGSPSITSDPGAIAIGILSNASNQYGGIAYFAQFIKYGVSSLNKVVLSDNISGYADWGKVTSSYTTGANGTFTSADSKTITVTNGLITSIV